MMKRLSILALGIAVAALVFLPATFAQRPDCDGCPGGHGPHGKAFGPGGPRGEMGMSPRMMGMLDLSDAQREQMKALRESHFEATSSLRAQLKGFHDEMFELWSVPTPDKDAILAKMAELDAIHLQLRAMQVEHRLEMRSLLSAEQLETMLQKRTRIRELHEELGDGPGGMRGKRGEGHHRHHGRHHQECGGPS